MDVHEELPLELRMRQVCWWRPAAVPASLPDVHSVRCLWHWCNRSSFSQSSLLVFARCQMQDNKSNDSQDKSEGDQKVGPVHCNSWKAPQELLMQSIDLPRCCLRLAVHVIEVYLPVLLLSQACRPFYSRSLTAGHRLRRATTRRTSPREIRRWGLCMAMDTAPFISKLLPDTPVGLGSSYV